MTIEWMRRIEPMPPYGDLQRGFANGVADPVWMLSRQWQLGEHVGEDAGVPVGVTFEVTPTPLAPVAGQDPTVVPAEAILEGSGAGLVDDRTPGPGRACREVEARSEATRVGRVHRAAARTLRRGVHR